MKKILLGVMLALASVVLYRSCVEAREQKTLLKENSMLLQRELKNVSKLIVTEGHFVEVYNYTDSKELFGSLVTSAKKALVVVNAEVTVSYDLSKIAYKVDGTHKTITITQIPEPEIKINPDFEYYDVTADYLNPFNAEDYNTIKQNVLASLQEKIAVSPLKANAENRLISELSKIYVLTNSLGWTLVTEDNIIKELEEIYLDEKTLVP